MWSELTVKERVVQCCIGHLCLLIGFYQSQVPILPQKLEDRDPIFHDNYISMDFPDGSDGRDSACNQETGVQSLGQENPLEEGMVTHSSITACRIPWTEKPGGVQTIGS